MVEPKNNFHSRFKEFLKSPAYFDDMWEREENYAGAICLIKNKEKIDKLSIKDAFLLLTLFHSGGVERHRNEIASEIERFKKLIATIFTICQDKTEPAFDKAKLFLDTPGAKVAGAGRNVVSEIFHTFDCIRFPVLNKNFESGLLYFGFIKTPFSGSFGEKYYQCIKVVQKIREKFQIKSCQVLDCFFNFIYWQNKKKFSPEEYEAWIKNKRRKKKKYLKISDKTMETFEIEFLPVQYLPDDILNALREVLMGYDRASISCFYNIYDAYKVLIAKNNNKQLVDNKDKVYEESVKHVIFTGDTLPPEELNICKTFIATLLEDIKKFYLI